MPIPGLAVGCSRVWSSCGEHSPQAIRRENGPELIAETFLRSCESKGKERGYIQPGKPDQNAYIGRFNLTYREEVLNAYIFENLDPVSRISADWIRDYNEERHHKDARKRASSTLPSTDSIIDKPHF